LLYHEQGRPDEAEGMHKHALAGFQEMYGPSHKKLTRASKWLALVRFAIGELLRLQLLYPADNLFKASRDAESLSAAIFPLAVRDKTHEELSIVGERRVPRGRCRRLRDAVRSVFK
jgi:hypothetical protein